MNAASKFLGLSVKEALLLPVGLVLDMVEVEIGRRGLKKDEPQ
ncbi:hypothetical protein AALB19_01530 [Oscillospiraceae bacterium 50-58]